MNHEYKMNIKIIVIGLLFSLIIFTGCMEKTNTENNNIDKTNKWMLYRDLFTPMNNDNVTVENAGYDAGWLFWVNHSRTLNSFYFPDQQNYLIKINAIDGDIELLE